MATQSELAETTGAAGHIIKRPRLTKILDETEARIILLCAPAGYGKTTLAREWVATRSEPVLWYSGGPAMADVAALAVDLAELFAGADSELAERVRFLASRGEGPRVLAKALAKSSPPDGTLVVIDDYHYASASSESNSFVDELVRLTAFRLLLTTRIQPEWITPRAVVYGEAMLVEQAALTFTSAEAEQVLPEAQTLLELAHGWPAVVGLAALRREASDAVKSVSPNQLYDYVASNMFDAVNEPLRVGLLSLSAGGDAAVEVARDALGSTYDEVVSAAVDRGFALRGADGWISIHPLLREFLLRQLAEQEVDLRDTIVSRALSALSQHARWDECLQLLETLPNEALAAHVVESAIVDLLAAGRTTTLEKWVELAKTHGFGAPIFVLADAEVALRQGRDLAAESLASAAARRLSGDMAARAYLAAARAAHQCDDVEATWKYAERAQAKASAPDLKTEAAWLAFASAYERAPKRMPKYHARLKAVDDPRPEHAFRLACAETFALIGEGGDTRAALSQAERAIAISAHVRDPLLRTGALNLRAHLLRMTGEYAIALEVVEDLLEEAERSELGFVTDHALLAKAGALIGLRELAQAKKALRALQEGSRRSQHIRVNASILGARLRIAAGDLDGAATAVSPDAPCLPPPLHGEYLVLRGLIDAARGRQADAERAISAAAAAPLYSENGAYVALARAVTLAGTGDGPTAAGDAIRTALESGHADAVVTACRAYPRLAELGVDAGVGRALESLFGRSHDSDLGRSAGLAMPREVRRRGRLTPREREVLQLVAQGRTNAEIGRTLFIGASTAKVHVKHILEKLGVHTRAEAAAAAETELGLD